MKPLGIALGASGILIAVYLVLALGAAGTGGGAAPLVTSFGTFSRKIITSLQGR